MELLTFKNFHTMINMKQILLLLIPFLISCQTKKENNQYHNDIIIDLDNYSYQNEPLKLSEIASTIDYVAFETRKNSFITQGANYKVTNNYYLLSQRGQIMQFDLSGKFLRNLVTVKGTRRRILKMF